MEAPYTVVFEIRYSRHKIRVDTLATPSRDGICGQWTALSKANIVLVRCPAPSLEKEKLAF